MKQHNDPKKIQLFSKNVTYRQNLNFMYGCYSYQIKINVAASLVYWSRDTNEIQICRIIG